MPGAPEAATADPHAGLVAPCATAQAALLAAGEVAAVELTSAYLDRIAALDGPLNSVVNVDRDGALRAAAELDRTRRRGGPAGPLHGLPVLVKEIMAVAGLPFTGAATVRRAVRADVDAPVVAALRAAGAVVLGTTNLTEWAIGATGRNDLYGPARNPWAPGRSAGGSSSGSAAAVAARLCAAAVGTDTGGSIRIPAALCGVVGVRPSIGAVPTGHVLAVSPDLDTVGPLTRTVADAALLLGVVAGHGAAGQAPAPYRDRPPRVGRVVLRDGVGEPGVLAALGHRLDGVGERLPVLDVDLGDLGLVAEAVATIINAQMAAVHSGGGGPGYAGAAVAARIERGRRVTRAEAASARAALRDWRERSLAVFDDVDVLALPTVGTVAPPLTDDPDDPEVVRGLTRHTYPFSGLGGPSASLPAGLVGGLPVGVQLAGAPGTDRAFLAAAAAVEAALTPVPQETT